MPHENLKKALSKINKEMAHLSMPLAIPVGNKVHRRVMFAAICLMTIVAFGVIMNAFGSSKMVVSASSVQGFGAAIYWDKACTNRTLSLNWGLIRAGSNITLTLYVKNESNSLVSLQLETLNWTPSNSDDFMSLNWNYSNRVLGANQVIPLELTLTVDPNIVGITGFSFETIITATQR